MLVAKALEINLPNVLFDVSGTSDVIVAFVYKADHQNIRQRLALKLSLPANDHEGGSSDTETLPTKIEVANFAAKQGRANAKQAQNNLIHKFQEHPGKHVSNMHLARL